jgi:glycosyltransferase involved in cell wall biosynthesis
VKPIRTAIVYHFIAHYREPVFRLLCSGDDRPVQYHVFAAAESDDTSLKVLRHDPQSTSAALVARWTPVRNYWFLGRVLWQPAVVKLACSRRFECIILLGNAYYMSSWLAAILARLTGKRVLMWTHGFLRRDRPLKRLTRYAFYRLADGLLLYGNRARMLLREMGYPNDRMHVVYNSLDHDLQLALRKSFDETTRDSVRRELGVAADHRLLVSVGRLNRPKRYGELIEAVARARADGARLRLVLIGDGPERGALESVARQLGEQDRVLFMGACYDERRLAGIISSADLFVVPGDIGLSCIHAFAYGVPVITHDNLDTQNPEVEAIRPGRNGDLYREHDVEDLARVIARWLKRLDEPGARREIAGECTDVIDRFYNATYQCEAIDRAVQGLAPMTQEPGGVIESPRR